ncbi:DUF6355 family natural product biosynthesis protein [Amycolatopsis alba]
MQRMKSGRARRAARATVVLGAATVSLCGIASTASASPTMAVAASKPCGYSESEGHAWYKHCTSDGSRIVIRLDVPLGRDEDRCVGPGETDLGLASRYRGAKYTGRLC